MSKDTAKLPANAKFRAFVSIFNNDDGKVVKLSQVY